MQPHIKEHAAQLARDLGIAAEQTAREDLPKIGHATAKVAGVIEHELRAAVVAAGHEVAVVAPVIRRHAVELAHNLAAAAEDDWPRIEAAMGRVVEEIHKEFDKARGAGQPAPAVPAPAPPAPMPAPDAPPVPVATDAPAAGPAGAHHTRAKKGS